MRRTALIQALLVGMISVSCLGQAESGGKMTSSVKGWLDMKTIKLKGLSVTLSQPVLVARSKGYLWYPTLLRVGENELLAILSNIPDVLTDKPTGLITWSLDRGLTWSEPEKGPYADCAPLRVGNGDLLLLSNYLYPKTNDMSTGCHKIVQGKRDVQVLVDGVTITNWPRPVRSFDSKLGLAGFGFTGQTVGLKDGGYLATLYGYFKDAPRYSLVAAHSVDGRHWSIRSVIADEKCSLQGNEGPCEAAMCRLKDGRLMCVFRNAGNVPYGQCWSQDEGKTWTRPVAMANAHSVQPSLAVMKDGTVALSGGRPGIFLWISADGTGNDWQRVDVQAHHSAFCPTEPIANSEIHPTEPIGSSTCYTEVAGLDDKHFLLIYDRVPYGWNPIPKDSQESNSVWIVRVGVSRDGEKAAR